MKKVLILLLLCSTFFTIAQNTKMVESNSYNQMLKLLLEGDVPAVAVEDAAANDSAIFIDTRELKEFKVSHLKNAVWAGYEDFDLERLDGISKNQEIIVYCSVGKRSEDITRKLQNEGYQNVKNLYGGIFEWINQSHPVFDAEGETENVHPFSRIWGVWLNRGNKTTGK